MSTLNINTTQFIRSVETENIQVNTETNINSEIHPCKYCDTPCKGKQCKKCHLKMVAALQGKCIECHQIFYAKRKDGTFRQRCSDCQDKYTKTHIAKCPDCDKDYYAFLDDGRVFSKCFDCYTVTKKSFQECEVCKKKSYKGPLCHSCYLKDKEVKIDNKELIPCRTKDCKNTSTYTFCSTCNRNRKNIDNTYMVFTCKNCGIRGMGDRNYCTNCN